MNVWIWLSTILYFELSSSYRRISKGVDASIDKFPFIVHILQPSVHSAGAIINRRHVVTSAVIIYAYANAVIDGREHTILRRNSSELSVIAGTDDVNGNGGVVYGAESILTHPSYEPNGTIVDAIGLIRVDRDIVFTPLIQPIPLSCDMKICVGCPATIVGWGREAENKSNKLQSTEVNFVSETECVSVWKDIAATPRRFICTSKRGVKGLCCGDTGAPVVAIGYLMGIGSFSTASDTAEHLPDVHIRVSFYKNWIHNHAKP